MSAPTDEYIFQPLLSRRTLVRGAACLAGASVLGLARPSSAESPGGPTLGSPLSASPLTMAFWNGSRLVDARRLAPAATASRETSVYATVGCHAGAGSILRGLSALYPVRADNGERLLLPYHAWTASEHGSRTGAFVMPIEDGGISLCVDYRSAGGVVTETCRMTHFPEDGAVGLRPGTYLIACGAKWNDCSFRPAVENETAQVLHDGAPANFDCLIVEIKKPPRVAGAACLA